ncbi:MAG: cyclic nucleotide-binding domain-containing protein [Anaerolineales bacterium]|jgi:CRP-like cAMP-binding protein|uniref:Crp/Fnr family transcriptional regulator n=1 Tax=Candidatus Villigracilis vicinus TaxID=3140679 RepID=UPI0031360B18|nr:cyclic nucleotide-binding domain-containing protein [Anaerolineales bacterium]MBK7449044.1 cyclic nucleotide-binding domain-containing protein [Anaerolineales bacterium]MBK9780783.1 cyclic nucleotide-binding domain-containing protein [Anaerolineales bacterium]
MISTETLSQFSLFNGLPESLLREIAAISTEAEAKQGEFVFHEGEKADKLHFLLKGSIALRVKLTSRPESVTVSFISTPFRSFGWSGIVPPFHYTSSAECDEDSTLLSIPADSFMKLLENNPEHGFVVMRRVAEIVADRLRNSHQALLKTL